MNPPARSGLSNDGPKSTNGHDPDADVVKVTIDVHRIRKVRAEIIDEFEQLHARWRKLEEQRELIHPQKFVEERLGLSMEDQALARQALWSILEQQSAIFDMMLASVSQASGD